MSGNTLSNNLINVEGTFVGSKKRDAMFASITSRLKKSIHKYSIEVPTTVKHANTVGKMHANSTLLYDHVLAFSSTIKVQVKFQ